jgi:hypothetical protein
MGCVSESADSGDTSSLNVYYSTHCVFADILDKYGKVQVEKVGVGVSEVRLTVGIFRHNASQMVDFNLQEESQQLADPSTYTFDDELDSDQVGSLLEGVLL